MFFVAIQAQDGVCVCACSQFLGCHGRGQYSALEEAEASGSAVQVRGPAEEGLGASATAVPVAVQFDDDTYDLRSLCLACLCCGKTFKAHQFEQ